MAAWLKKGGGSILEGGQGRERQGVDGVSFYYCCKVVGQLIIIIHIITTCRIQLKWVRVKSGFNCWKPNNKIGDAFLS